MEHIGFSFSKSDIIKPYLTYNVDTPKDRAARAVFWRDIIKLGVSSSFVQFGLRIKNSIKQKVYISRLS